MQDMESGRAPLATVPRFNWVYPCSAELLINIFHLSFQDSQQSLQI